MVMVEPTPQYLRERPYGFIAVTPTQKTPVHPGGSDSNRRAADGVDNLGSDWLEKCSVFGCL